MAATLYRGSPSMWADADGTHTFKTPRPNATALRALGPVVYAVRIADSVIKFGYTSDLSKRLVQLAPRPQLLGFLPGATPWDEYRIHHLLRGHRYHANEWYNPTPEVMAVVNRMRADLGMEPTG